MHDVPIPLLIQLLGEAPVRGLACTGWKRAAAALSRKIALTDEKRSGTHTPVDAFSELRC
jgi:hypothetical protein